jgi:hypothetical protein
LKAGNSDFPVLGPDGDSLGGDVSDIDIPVIEPAVDIAPPLFDIHIAVVSVQVQEEIVGPFDLIDAFKIQSGFSGPDRLLKQALDFSSAIRAGRI